MAEHIRIRKVEGRWSVRAGGAVLGESSDVLELSEGDMRPVLYFPRGDIAMQFLDRSEKTSHCPHKGEAHYYSIMNKSATLQDAVWTYETPHEGVAAIKDHLAFEKGSGVTVEKI